MLNELNVKLVDLFTRKISHAPQMYIDTATVLPM